MKRKWICAAAVLCGLGFGCLAQQAIDWDIVAEALGRKGNENGSVYRVAFPRSDLQVKVGPVSLDPGLALTSWAAFQKTASSALVMGDLVLAAPEVPAVTSALLEDHLEITAIHNHLIGEEPRVMYLHFHGHGALPDLARAVRRALGATGTPPAVSPSVTVEQVAAPNREILDRVLAYAGVRRGAIVAYSIPRSEPIRSRGEVLGPALGLATAINFQKDGTGAVTTGDFVLLASEVQSVLRALRASGIEVTALHNHMLEEEPRLFFLHFWGRGPEENLARGLRSAFDSTNHRHP